MWLTSLLQDCWNQLPFKRPRVHEAIQHIKAHSKIQSERNATYLQQKLQNELNINDRISFKSSSCIGSLFVLLKNASEEETVEEILALLQNNSNHQSREEVFEALQDNHSFLLLIDKIQIYKKNSRITSCALHLLRESCLAFKYSHRFEEEEYDWPELFYIILCSVENFLEEKEVYIEGARTIEILLKLEGYTEILLKRTFSLLREGTREYCNDLDVIQFSLPAFASVTSAILNSSISNVENGMFFQFITVIESLIDHEGKDAANESSVIHNKQKQQQQLLCKRL